MQIETMRVLYFDEGFYDGEQQILKVLWKLLSLKWSSNA
jgi:hypothetical protein